MSETAFTSQEKERLFDMISKRYFERNFGTMLKPDFETLIFSAYIEHLLDNNLPFDDHTISNKLGITEARVRKLKERKQLQYPYAGYEWKKAFAALIPNAKYNEQKKLIQLTIGDVNLMNDVRSFISSKGWFDEFQINPKLFQCRLEYFVCLCNELSEAVSFTEEAKGALMELAKNEKEKSAIGKLVGGSFEDGIKELLFSATKEGAKSLLSLIPFGGLAGEAIHALINIL